jgi:hypothetical protein
VAPNRFDQLIEPQGRRLIFEMAGLLIVEQQ